MAVVNWARQFRRLPEARPRYYSILAGSATRVRQPRHRIHPVGRANYRPSPCAPVRLQSCALAWVAVSDNPRNGIVAPFPLPGKAFKFNFRAWQFR